jgi:hypothetical protein
VHAVKIIIIIIIIKRGRRRKAKKNPLGGCLAGAR